MDLDAVRDFNLVASHGGLGAASRAARRPKATLSRRVAELERQLGVRLIERGDRGLRLTEEGRLLHERTHGPLAELIEAGEAVASGIATPRGTLRVSAPLVLAHVTLVPIALRYADACPLVRLEIVAEDRTVDPVEDGYDVVLRIDPSAGDRLVGRKILDDERFVVAAPGVSFPIGKAAERTVRGVMLATVSARSAWRIRRPDGSVVTLVPDAALRFSSLLMVRDAVLRGAGAALLPKLLVADDVAAGRLVHWGTLAGPTVEIWALHSGRRLTSTKVTTFLSILDASLR